MAAGILRYGNQAGETAAFQEGRTHATEEIIEAVQSYLPDKIEEPEGGVA